MQERKPIVALAGFVALGLVWASVVFAFRAWEIPDVGPPLDVAAFRAGIPLPQDDHAAKEVNAALAEFSQFDHQQIELFLELGDIRVDEALSKARDHLKAAARLPTGVLESPRSDGMPTLLHVPQCKRFAEILLSDSKTMDPTDAADCVNAVLITCAGDLRIMASDRVVSRRHRTRDDGG